MAKKTKYAQISWNAEDVKVLRPKWSYEKCEEWLSSNERRIMDRTVELGWEVLGALL